jgi:hypothetical protein
VSWYELYSSSQLETNAVKKEGVARGPPTIFVRVTSQRRWASFMLGCDFERAHVVDAPHYLIFDSFSQLLRHMQTLMVFLPSAPRLGRTRSVPPEKTRSTGAPVAGMAR